MSVLSIVLIAVAVLVVLVFVGGVLGARKRDRAVAPHYLQDVAAADQALEQARAEDRGWHRDTMEEAARAALEASHPGRSFQRLDLVLVDDRPGVMEDRAHFEAWDGEESVRVVLSRGERGWAADASPS